MTSYGHTYLTSYGWSGTGNALRKGAIAKPLAIPPKKNLGGLGKDRDEAFPFWDHLFTAASKAITIRVSSDEEEDIKPDCPPSSSDLQRTTTGILSHRRPVSGTPVSTSGSTTPIPTADDARLSLLAVAKKEAAKRGLYARFFKGPVLGPDGERDASDSNLSSEPGPAGGQDRIVGDVETQNADANAEERREQKRLKKERKAAKAAKRADRALAREKANRINLVGRKEKRTRSEESDTASKKTRKRARKPPPGGKQETRTRSEQQDTSCRHNHADATDVLITKKIPPSHSSHVTITSQS